jgi:hypothetical protein
MRWWSGGGLFSVFSIFTRESIKTQDGEGIHT